MKENFNTTKSHWKTSPTLWQEKKKSARKIMETLLERGSCTRTTESAYLLETGEAYIEKTSPRVFSDHWKRKQTYPSRATCPTEARSTVWRPWRTHISTWCFYRMAILSFFHTAFVFIFVISMATKQRRVVNVELGLMGIFILEWTVTFYSFQMSDFAFAWRKFNLLAIDRGVWTVHRPRTRYSHAHFASVLVPACCHSCPGTHSHIVTHWPSAHAWLKTQGAHCLCLAPETVTLHRAMPCVTPH